MKSSRLIKYFDEYVKKYDMNNASIKAKYFHSLKSMDLAREIASSLNCFTDEEIVVCELAALFHEIGGFENTSGYHMIDEEAEDGSVKSIEILFESGLLRKITPDTKYDNIIKAAIYCHNKIGLPNNIDNKTKVFCNVLKDVHKIDAFRMAINYPYIDFRLDEYPTSLAYNSFKNFKTVDVKLSENNTDDVLVVLSSVFSLNYKCSMQVIIKENYVYKIYNSLIFSDKKLEKFMRDVCSALANYLGKRVLV